MFKNYCILKNLIRASESAICLPPYCKQTLGAHLPEPLSGHVSVYFTFAHHINLIFSSLYLDSWTKRRSVTLLLVVALSLDLCGSSTMGTKSTGAEYSLIKSSLSHFLAQFQKASWSNADLCKP